MNTKSMICSNPWCRAVIQVSEDWNLKECPKCYSFDKGGLSGGVTWTEKKYDGPRDDGQPHRIDYKIQRAGEKRKLW